MLKKFLAIIPLLILTGAATAQYKAAEPDKWENYLASEYKFSIMFPRSPVRFIDMSNECFGRGTAVYAIYKDGVAYSLRLTYKVDPPDVCTEKSSFSSDEFKKRLEDFAESKREKTPALIKGARAEQYRGDSALTRLYNDPKNDRWFELTVQGKFENNPEIAKFFESFVTGKHVSGTEIGEGWNNLAPAPIASPGKIVSDSGPAATPGNAGSAAGPGGSSGPAEGIGNAPGAGTGRRVTPLPGAKFKSVILLIQPKPPYTKEAKQAQIQGTVVLRVTFNANGRIGSISPVKGLGYGLTEEAIKAATRIVFIPGSREDFPITMTKAVQYTFILY